MNVLGMCYECFSQSILLSYFLTTLSDKNRFLILISSKSLIISCALVGSLPQTFVLFQVPEETSFVIFRMFVFSHGFRPTSN